MALINLLWFAQCLVPHPRSVKGPGSAKPGKSGKTKPKSNKKEKKERREKKDKKGKDKKPKKETPSKVRKPKA